jgi:hypothetical protein
MTHDPIQVRWEHAHQCHVCGHVVRIDDIDAKVIATGNCHLSEDAMPPAR